ncbi:MAG: KUP/HAK/KT family potassium transporter, partial [Rhodanobacter sp.]
VNTLLLVGVLLLVALFRSSSALASAYGIAVTGTMVVTAAMAFVVIWRVWGWSPLSAGLLIAPFLVIDVTFLAANLLKIVQGGWFPIVLGIAPDLVLGHRVDLRRGVLRGRDQRPVVVPLAAAEVVPRQPALGLDALVEMERGLFQVRLCEFAVRDVAAHVRCPF